MIDVKFLEQFVSIQSVASSIYEGNPFISEVSRIASTRLYGLNLPRCTGKTTALEDFANTRSALRFDGTRCRFVSRFDNGFDRAITLGSFRGQKSNGLRYQCCVADEFMLHMHQKEAREFFWQSIIDLNNANMLTKDFFILYLGTDSL